MKKLVYIFDKKYKCVSFIVHKEGHTLIKRYDIGTVICPRAVVWPFHYIAIIYLKDITLKEYFIWVCCVNIFQLTLQANNCMKCLRKTSVNKIAGKQGQ